MIDVLKSRVGYDKHPQQWKEGFDLACREMQVRIDQSNAYIQELIERHKRDIIDLENHEHQKTLVMRKQLEYLMDCNFRGLYGQLSPAPIVVDRSDALELSSILKVGCLK